MIRTSIRIRPEQIYTVYIDTDGVFIVGGHRHKTMPWMQLSGSYLYAVSETDLIRMLEDATTRNYMIMDGAHDFRRGTRGFNVAIGAWGHSGKVECKTIDAWCVTLTDHDPAAAAEESQDILRETCRTLNAEATTFRATALKWLSGVYNRIGKLHEPGETQPPPLKASIAMLCRNAHVGGPIIHGRTTLEPFVSIDRKRAYGTALMGDLPSGSAREIELGADSLRKWRPNAFMRAFGVADATVHVAMGPFMPLLPVMRWHHRFNKNHAIYPTGHLRGAWTLLELAYLEQSGRGHVEKFHRIVTFDKARPFAPVIRYIRRLEKDLDGISVKRFEHILYGTCARSLDMTRFASARSDIRPVPSDILDNRMLARISAQVSMRPFTIRREGQKAARPSLPLYQVTGRLTEEAPHGSMDRPDRSAWITAHNRVAMCKLIDKIDAKLGVSRSGSYIGRVYVDGMDIQARPEDLPPMDDVEIRNQGQSMRIYRAGVFVCRQDDGSVIIEDGGIDQSSEGTGTVEDLERTLQFIPAPDGGPMASGRLWHAIPGVEDPRMLPNRISEPLHLDLAVVESMGFGVTQ